MSDFLIHAARMQDAGVTSLWVSLGSSKDRTRLMHVSPDASTPPELAVRFPTRTFELNGTDRQLQDLQDEMAYSDDGPTKEKIEAACKAYPNGAVDLVEWYADWKACPPITDEELEDPENQPTEEELKRGLARMKGLMEGYDAARALQAQTSAPAQPAPIDAAALAQLFHETYERLAPQLGYETRKESAKPWTEVPENNRKLMTAVCAEILKHTERAGK